MRMSSKSVPLLQVQHRKHPMGGLRYREEAVDVGVGWGGGRETTGADRYPPTPHRHSKTEEVQDLGSLATTARKRGTAGMAPSRHEAFSLSLSLPQGHTHAHTERQAIPYSIGDYREMRRVLQPLSLSLSLSLAPKTILTPSSCFCTRYERQRDRNRGTDKKSQTHRAWRQHVRIQVFPRGGGSGCPSTASGRLFREQLVVLLGLQLHKSLKREHRSGAAKVQHEVHHEVPAPCGHRVKVRAPCGRQPFGDVQELVVVVVNHGYAAAMIGREPGGGGQCGKLLLRGCPRGVCDEQRLVHVVVVLPAPYHSGGTHTLQAVAVPRQQHPRLGPLWGPVVVLAAADQPDHSLHGLRDLLPVLQLAQRGLQDPTRVAPVLAGLQQELSPGDVLQALPAAPLGCLTPGTGHRRPSRGGGRWGVQRGHRATAL
eukprot:RCo039294